MVGQSSPCSSSYSGQSLCPQRSEKEHFIVPNLHRSFSQRFSSHDDEQRPGELFSQVNWSRIQGNWPHLIALSLSRLTLCPLLLLLVVCSSFSFFSHFNRLIVNAMKNSRNCSKKFPLRNDWSLVRHLLSPWVLEKRKREREMFVLQIILVRGKRRFSFKVECIYRWITFVSTLISSNGKRIWWWNWKRSVPWAERKRRKWFPTPSNYVRTKEKSISSPVLPRETKHSPVFDDSGWIQSTNRWPLSLLLSLSMRFFP